jgi:calcineurin-like phosphoesterase family protein
MSRTIVIGDIHGCFDELVALLDLVDLQTADRVVAVGDLTVKGNKSKEVLDLFIEDSRFSSVLGNHDRSIVRFWRGETSSLKNSQRQTLDELKPNRSRYCEYLGSLPLLIDLGSHVVVHAGVRPGIPFAQQSPEDLTELRTLGADRTSRDGMPWYEVYDGEQLVLFGHWPSAEPRMGKQAIGLDTGCVYGGRLTAYIIESNEFKSVPALQAYDAPNVTNS